MISGVVNVDCLHAGMTKKEREDAVSRMRRGESWVMVSTEVMARGMDFKGVREVINYDFPQSVQSYVHRIGKLEQLSHNAKPIDCSSQAVQGVRDARARPSHTSQTKTHRFSRRKRFIVCFAESEISYCPQQDRECAATIWIGGPRVDLEAS